MEFAEAVRRRRMVRHFAPDAIERDVLERIAAAAQRALPDVKSPSLTRGWRSLDEFAHWDAW